MVETFTEGHPAPEVTPVSAPEAPAAAPAVKDDTPFENVRAAAQALARRRQEKRNEAAKIAPPAQESPPQEGEAAQPEAGPGETQEVDPVALELSPIEPPRSWKKEYKAAFEALPRNVQEQVAESERARESDFLRRQNEVAERQKAFEQELSQVQAVRQHYEQGISQALQMTMASNEFADIKTMDDVEALSRDDWPRWVRYQTHQQKVGMLQQQLQEVQHANAQEQYSRWSQFAEQQDTLFSEKYPDAKELKAAAVEYLVDQAGFSREEIGRYWNSQAWRDNRMQGIILDAVRYHKAKDKAAAAKKAPPVTVQKPGVSAPKTNHFQAQISDLESKGGLSLREAAKLNQLRRMAAKA
jgi:hypothetical protein